MKDFFRKSLPKTSIIHGVEVKKLPIGKYLDAIDSIKGLPEILLKNSFPDASSDEILQKFKKIDEQMFFELVSNLIVTVPEQALKFISNLIDVPYEKLRNELGLNELKDILKEFWRINDLSSFFQDILGALQKSQLIQMITQKK